MRAARLLRATITTKAAHNAANDVRARRTRQTRRARRTRRTRQTRRARHKGGNGAWQGGVTAGYSRQGTTSPAPPPLAADGLLSGRYGNHAPWSICPLNSQCDSLRLVGRRVPRLSIETAAGAEPRALSGGNVSIIASSAVSKVRTEAVPRTEACIGGLQP